LNTQKKSDIYSVDCTVWPGTKEQGSFGEGGGGSNMEARVAKLEADVEHIKNSVKDIKDDVREIKRDARTDFRLLFGAIIAATLGLAGIMAKGFHWF
jgi:tetrahydromethanopterin S-methyltransferase subunit F